MSPFNIQLTAKDRANVASALQRWFLGLPTTAELQPADRDRKLEDLSQFAQTLNLRVDDRGVTIVPDRSCLKTYSELQRGTLSSPRIADVTAFVVSSAS